MNDVTPINPAALPGRDHNAPPRPVPLSPQQVREWLDWQHETLRARQAQILHALEQTAKAYPAVTSDEADAVVTDNISLTNALIKAFKMAHDDAKAGFLAAGRAVDAWRAALLEPVEKLKADLTSRQTVYQVAREAREKAEAAQRAAELEQAAAAQARIAMQATDPVTRDAAYDLAEHMTTQQSKLLQYTQGRNGTKTRGQYGTSSLRRTWGYRITNLAKVPRTFLCADDAKIKEAMRQRDAENRPTRVIPGVEWVLDAKTTHR